MPQIKFTQEDLNSKKQLPAAWYKLKVKAVKDETARDGQSTNWVTDFVIAEGPFANTPFRHWFNEKAMGRVLDFLACFMADGKIDPAKTYELSDLVGHEVMGFCKYDIERKWNSAEDFKPVPK